MPLINSTLPMPLRIVVVDSDGGLVPHLGDFLDAQRFCIERATTIDEAIGVISRRDDVLFVVADLDVHGGTGPEWVKFLRYHHPNVPLIILSETFSAKAFTNLADFGNTKIIRKPVHGPELIESIRRLIRRCESGMYFFPHIQDFTSAFLEMEYRTDEINPAQVASFLANLIYMLSFCGESTAGQIEMAIQETLINAVEHGNLELSSDLKESATEGPDQFSGLRRSRLEDEKYASRKIRVGCTVKGARMELKVRDEGRGFDHVSFMKRLDDPDDPDGSMKSHGRGLLIIKGSMDEVSFDREGREVTLVKYAEYYDKLHAGRPSVS
jgi:anti-sigma regulatory factor (Ser/Thr protein kinase)/CheY-like chemotaxis protein